MAYKAGNLLLLYLSFSDWRVESWGQLSSVFSEHQILELHIPRFKSQLHGLLAVWLLWHLGDDMKIHVG
jgi:hypothetical protein